MCVYVVYICRRWVGNKENAQEGKGVQALAAVRCDVVSVGYSAGGTLLKSYMWDIHVCAISYWFIWETIRVIHAGRYGSHIFGVHALAAMHCDCVAVGYSAGSICDLCWIGCYYIYLITLRPTHKCANLSWRPGGFYLGSLFDATNVNVFCVRHESTLRVTSRFSG